MMKNRENFLILISLFLLSSLYLACRTNTKETLDPEFLKSKNYIETGENCEAEKLFEQLLKKEPKNPQYLYGYALSGGLCKLQRTGEIIQKLFETIREFKFAPEKKSKTVESQLLSKQGRVLIDAFLELIFRILILDTVDKVTYNMKKFLEVADNNFVFDIQKMTINFFAGGKSLQKFTVWGKHGIEEANLLYAIAQIIRTLVYSLLSLSFNAEISDVFMVYNYALEHGGIMALFAYPLTVGFPSIMYLLERNQNILTAPFKDEMNTAKTSLIEGAKALHKNQSMLAEKFSSGIKREGFMISYNEKEDKSYIKAALGEEDPKIIVAGNEGIEGIRETVRGAENILKSLEGKGLVKCEEISGPAEVFLTILADSGFVQALASVAEASAPTEAKRIAEDFYRSIIYYLDWFFAIHSACTQDAILFDFSKLWYMLENLRGAIPVWFSLAKENEISVKRNLLIEWECETSTYDLNLEKLERNFNYLFCARKSTFSDSEHFSVPLTLGIGIKNILGFEVGEDRINPLSKNPLQKDGIPTPYPYIILPNPSFHEFLYIDTRVFWPSCEVPCGFSCEVVKPEGLKGLCLINASLAQIGKSIYGIK